ncbi:rab GDP dissociation inhibitor beta-like isoform X1 [Macrotis lagotis]|uniref:rab GDP dissociation inhibitor beta-like isoform X1 n=1 Tax=Macrotis lagotis TaxID=92651 RepID=UPI003D69D672
MKKDYYDIIILGTGLKECILGSLLASLGKKVLHLDRSGQPGGESALLNPLNIACRSSNVSSSPCGAMGPGHSWKVDLLPKFLMASGLIGFFEKHRFRKFFTYALKFKEHEPRTYKGVDPWKTVGKDLFQHFDLGQYVPEFAGHALALSRTNCYLDHPCIELLKKIQLYISSLTKNGKSPYLYPRCGIGELAQAFAQLTSSQGGVFLMNKPVDDIIIREGRVVGIRSEGHITSCKQLICDPSYAPDLVHRVGQVIRAICILGHPIRNTSGAKSGLVIIPSTQAKRKSDIYIFITSSIHNLAAQGKYIAIVTTTVESKEPEKEIQLALELLEPIEKKFFFVSDLYVPNDLGSKSQIFITTSYDATVHFENACNEIKEIYKRMTGSELKLD